MNCNKCGLKMTFYKKVGEKWIYICQCGQIQSDNRTSVKGDEEI